MICFPNKYSFKNQIKQIYTLNTAIKTYCIYINVVQHDMKTLLFNGLAFIVNVPKGSPRIK